MGQRTTTSRVIEHLNRDIIMTQCIHRGVLSLRGSARWLQDHGLGDCNLNAIVSALGRWDAEEPWLATGSWTLQKNAEVSVTDSWLVLDVPATLEDAQRLNHLQQRLEWADQSPPIFGSRTIRLAVKKHCEQEARTIMGNENIDREFHDAVRLGFHREADDDGLPLATTLWLKALGLQGIEVLGTYGFDDERYVFVPPTQARNAYHIATKVARS